MLDLLFWNKFFESARTTPVERIEATAQAIKKLAPGLVKELAFSIYARKSGPGGGVRNLLE